MADLDLAFTFLDIASTSQVADTACRNQENARAAYDMVLRFLPRSALCYVLVPITGFQSYWRTAFITPRYGHVYLSTLAFAFALTYAQGARKPGKKVV